MTVDWLGWLPLMAGIAALGAAAGTLLVAAAAPGLEALVARVEPGRRFGLLLAIIAAPMIAAGVLLTVAFGGSALDALGLAVDHCAYHVDRAFHLCFTHGSPPAAWWPTLLLAPLAAALATALVTQARGARAARRWRDQLRGVGRRDDALDCWLVDAESLAVTVGLWRPEVFASSRLARQLGAQRWRAVLAHEHAHRRRRDGLVKSAARVLAAAHLPGARQRLLAQLDLASEQACDAAAARAVGDRFEVAATIVAMARLGAASKDDAQPHGSLAQTFGAHPVERRVQALLDGGGVCYPGGLGLAVAAVGAAALVGSYERLHHAFEAIITVFF